MSPPASSGSDLPSVEVDARGGAVRVACDLRVYPLDAVFSAAYVFLGRAYVSLARDGARDVRVLLRSKAPADRAALSALAGEFQNELCDQYVRARLAKQHTKLREMIVGRALFAAQGIGAEPAPEPAADADYLADPLGIAVPWEEKFLRDKGKDAAPAGDAPAQEAAAPAPGGPGPEKWTPPDKDVFADKTEPPAGTKK